MENAPPEGQTTLVLKNANIYTVDDRKPRAQALKMLTLSPAYAAFQEKVAGSITVGKRADLTVLSADIMTIIGGDIAYQRNPA